jgi:hypothetical protein
LLPAPARWDVCLGHVATDYGGASRPDQKSQRAAASSLK